MRGKLSAQTASCSTTKNNPAVAEARHVVSSPATHPPRNVARLALFGAWSDPALTAEFVPARDLQGLDVAREQ